MFVKWPGHSRLSPSSAAASRASLAYFLMSWVPVSMCICREAKPDLSAASFFLPSVNDVPTGNPRGWTPASQLRPVSLGLQPWSTGPGGCAGQCRAPGARCKEIEIQQALAKQVD